ncbi:hypothetical protein OIPHN330_09850 [Citrobacter freundii]|nr:hypothetical protein DJ483_20040 [Citrobacter freundii]BEJ32365.1 hypothetical protein OIPHN330_09850 [Citrobacter freundii]BEJ38271.1 hypothetical protein OIPHN354_09830 [Citrobacter freundii]
MYFHLFFNELLIFADSGDFRSGWPLQAVQQVRQPRTHFDHFVLFLNVRIVQLIENDQFLINDDFNETNMRRGKDERY